MSAPEVLIRSMTPTDYSQVLALWHSTEGIGLNESDEEAEIARYLGRNPGMSAVAVSLDGFVVGAALCGHDGRRGYLHHLAVARDFRRRGIATELVDFCLNQLKRAGIAKCNIFLFPENEDGKAFWLQGGWSERHWQVLQRVTEPE